MQPKRLKPTQPVYFNLVYKEDKEFWDDIHSDKIPNFTKWVKEYWNVWKQQTPIQREEKIKDTKIVYDNQEPQIFQSVQSEVESIPQKKPKGMNVNSLTKMFGMKIS